MAFKNTPKNTQGGGTASGGGSGWGSGNRNEGTASASTGGWGSRSGDADKGGVEALGRQFGLSREDSEKLAGMLAPAIGGAARRRAERGELDRVLGPLRGEAQGRLVDDPARAAEPEAREEGMNFLESLFGSRDAAGELAGQAAGRTGIDMGTIAQFLPALAAMLQGGMQRQVPDSEIDGALGGGSGGFFGRGGSGPQGGLGDLLGGLMGGGGGKSGGLGALGDLLRGEDEEAERRWGRGDQGGQQGGQAGGLGDLLGKLLR